MKEEDCLSTPERVDEQADFDPFEDSHFLPFEPKPEIPSKQESSYQYDSFQLRESTSSFDTSGYGSSSSSFNVSNSYFEPFTPSEENPPWESKENFYPLPFSQPKPYAWNYQQNYNLNFPYCAAPSASPFYLPTSGNSFSSDPPKENFDPAKSSTFKRPFVCSFANCGKSYTKSGHLIAHERCHMGVRTFVCDELVPLATPTSENSQLISQRMSPPPQGYKYCGVAFLRCDQLTRHRREHLKIKPFKCPYCDRNFNRSDHRLVHVRRHAPEERFSLEVEKDLLRANTFLPKRKRPRKPLAASQPCSTSYWI